MMTERRKNKWSRILFLVLSKNWIAHILMMYAGTLLYLAYNSSCFKSKDIIQQFIKY